MITLVNDYAGDWLAIYVDGYLEYENHSIEYEKLLDMVSADYVSMEGDFSSTGRAPEKLKDVKEKDE